MANIQDPFNVGSNDCLVTSNLGQGQVTSINKDIELSTSQVNSNESGSQIKSSMISSEVKQYPFLTLQNQPAILKLSPQKKGNKIVDCNQQKQTLAEIQLLNSILRDKILCMMEKMQCLVYDRPQIPRKSKEYYCLQPELQQQEQVNSSLEQQVVARQEVGNQDNMQVESNNESNIKINLSLNCNNELLQKQSFSGKSCGKSCSKIKSEILHNYDHFEQQNILSFYDQFLPKTLNLASSSNDSRGPRTSDSWNLSDECRNKQNSKQNSEVISQFSQLPTTIFHQNQQQEYDELGFAIPKSKPFANLSILQNNPAVQTPIIVKKEIKKVKIIRRTQYTKKERNQAQLI